MRTTLTVDDDIAIALRRRAEERGLGWKEVVNEVLREGMAALDAPPEPTPRYVTPVDDPGPPALRGVHSVHDLLAFAEGESYR